MHFINIATAFALATVAQAFVIPSGTTNGVYAVTIGEDGQEVHTKISDSTNIESIHPDNIETVSDGSDIERREPGRIWCGCGFNMNRGHCDRAVERLVAQMRPSIVNAGLSFYSIEYDVVTFACNRGSENWLLIGSQYREAIAGITRSCGQYIAGATQFGDNGKELILGYARILNYSIYSTPSLVNGFTHRGFLCWRRAKGILSATQTVLRCYLDAPYTILDLKGSESRVPPSLDQ
ncbi:hypothetical protein V494_06252 [Pseudogymnoascus sp. VKM F-4513 (FW-928)]|nr:hypothetical protein V494_06252 [Pseudogymnoascus sp. VKM F-4513 (FW-928)]